MEEPKKHFKMYKSGKHWVVAAIITTATQACLLVPHIAHADTVKTTNTIAITKMNSQSSTSSLTSAVSMSSNKHTSLNVAQSASSQVSAVATSATSHVPQASAVQTNNSSNATSQTSVIPTSASVAKSTHSSAASSALHSAAQSAVIVSAQASVATSTVSATKAHQDSAHVAQASHSVVSTPKASATSAASSALHSAAQSAVVVSAQASVATSTVSATKAHQDSAHVAQASHSVVSTSKASATSAVTITKKPAVLKTNVASVTTTKVATSTTYVQKQIDNHWYLYDDQGQMQYGQHVVDGATRYYDPTTGWMVTNKFVWLPVKADNQYGMTYFGSNGDMYKNGKYQIGSHWYYFNTNGAYATGLTNVDGVDHYYDPETGWMVTNKFVWLPVKADNQYGMTYFDNNGDMYKNGVYQIGNHSYYFDANGAYATGLTNVNGNDRYYDPETGWMVTNKFIWLPVKADNQYGMTYFGSDGNMYKNGKYQIGNHWYYFDVNGAYATGLTNINGQTYYCNPETGWMLTNGFKWLPINNGQYGMAYFANDGHMLTNGGYNIGGHWYVFNANGAYLTGWQNLNGHQYYIKDNGQLAVNTFVWLPVGPNNSWGMTYFDGNGQMYKNGKYQIGNHWYYFNQYGTYLTGWQNLNGQKYYFNNSGWMAQNMTNIDGKTYLFDNNGVLQTGWRQISWHEYFFNPDNNGAMNTGWSWANGQWLHFDNNGIFDGFNERVLEWFYDRIGHLTYSMSGSRNGSDGTADCSGSMTQAIADAGGARPAYLYNTETLHQYLLASGYHLVAENTSFTPQWGDVIIWGKLGESAGAGGHTLVITNDGPNANCISTCYYTDGQPGTAVQVLNYNYYWHLAGCPYFYVYRQGNKYRD